jgi:hypothetical protein
MSAEPAPCTGSGQDREYADEDVTYRDKSKARYARVSCPACGRTFAVKIVYTRSRTPINPPRGVVVVPRHRAAQGGLSVMAETFARRVTIHEARRHFESGGAVLVSEYGTETLIPVTPITTTHNRETITWAALVEQVRMWRSRYPRQRYYVIPASTAQEG